MGSRCHALGQAVAKMQSQVVVNRAAIDSRPSNALTESTDTNIQLLAVASTGPTCYPGLATRPGSRGRIRPHGLS